MGFLDIAPAMLSSRYLKERVKKDIFLSLFPHACASFEIKIKKKYWKEKKGFSSYTVKQSIT